MSKFKEMVQRDRKRVFLNMLEFGEEYNVEGNIIQIVVDNDELKRRQSGQDLSVTESAALFYAASEDLPKRRTAGETLTINGREHLIDDWQEDMGMATVILRENL